MRLTYEDTGETSPEGEQLVALRFTTECVVCHKPIQRLDDAFVWIVVDPRQRRSKRDGVACLNYRVTHSEKCPRHFVQKVSVESARLGWRRVSLRDLLESSLGGRRSTQTREERIEMMSEVMSKVTHRVSEKVAEREGAENKGAEHEVLTTDEVATALRVKPETVRGWCANGKIRSTKLPDGRYRIRSEELDRLRGANQ